MNMVSFTQILYGQTYERKKRIQRNKSWMVKNFECNCYLIDSSYVKSLQQWLRYLEDHISSLYLQPSTCSSFTQLPSDNASSFLSTASSISSVLQKTDPGNSWPTSSTLY